MHRVIRRRRRRLVTVATMFSAAVLGAQALALLVAPGSGQADASGATGTGGQFVAAQARVLDTRAASQIGPYSTPMPAGGWRAVAIEGQAGLPAWGIAAVAVNFSVFSPSAKGLIKADKDEAIPNTTITYMNYDPGVDESNSAVLAVGDDGKIQVEATTSTDLVVDVQGYYTAGDPAAGGYVPVAPTRLVDTRYGIGLPQARLTSGSTTLIGVGGHAGVPADASAVMVDFLVDNQTGSGHLTPYPAGGAMSSPPTTLRYLATGRDTISAQVALGNDPGAFNLYEYGGSLDLVVDVVGYFTAGQAAGTFTPAAARVFDTRVTPNTPIAANATVTVPVAGVAGLPSSGLSAVSANFSVNDLSGTTDSYIRVWADDASEPATTALYYHASSPTSDLVTTALGSDGGIKIRNHGTDSISVVLDVEGWYSPDAPVNVPTASGQFSPAHGTLLDTRDGTGGYATPMPANAWRTVNIDGVAGLPAVGVTAVLVDVTAFSTSGSAGVIKAISSDTSASDSNLSVLAFANGTTSTSAGVEVGSSGSIRILATATVDLRLDVEGYFSVAGPTTARLVDLTRTELANTQDGSGGYPASPIVNGQVVTTGAAGTDLVPTDATGALVTLAVSDASTGFGEVTIYPANNYSERLNLYWSGSTAASWTLPVPFDNGTSLTVQLDSGGPADISVDLAGYFTSVAGPSGTGTFTARQVGVLDTRDATQTPLAPGETREIRIAGAVGIPDLSHEDIEAALVNVEGWTDSASAPGDMSLRSSDDIVGAPLIFPRQQASSAATVVEIGADGTISVTNETSVSLEIVIDVQGWFDGIVTVNPSLPPAAVAHDDAGTPVGADISPSEIDSTDTMPSETDTEIANDAAAVDTTTEDGNNYLSQVDSASDPTDPEDVPAVIDDSGQALDATESAGNPSGTHFAGQTSAVNSRPRGPADPSAAKIGDQIVQTVNEHLAVYSPGGARKWQRSLQSIFHSYASASTDIFDPHVIAEPTKNRFIVVADQESKYFDLLVTSGSKLWGGGWCEYQIPATNQSIQKADFPLMGANSKYVYLTINDEHNNQLIGNRIVQLSLSRLTSCASLGPGAGYRYFDNVRDASTGDLAASVAPELDYSGADNYEYFVHTAPGGGTHVFVDWIINSNPSRIYHTSRTVGKYSKPHSVQQPDWPTKIDAGYAEVVQAVGYRFGTYFSYPSYNSACACNIVVWYKIDVDFGSGAVITEDRGSFKFSNGASALYPTLAQNHDGVGLFSVNVGGPHSFISSYVVRLSLGGNASVRKLVGGSTATTDGPVRDDGSLRWGDFTSVYPAGGGTFVTVAETGQPTGSGWSTELGLIQG